MAENNTEKRQETVQVDFERRLSGEAMQESIVAMSVRRLPCGQRCRPERTEVDA